MTDYMIDQQIDDRAGLFRPGWIAKTVVYGVEGRNCKWGVAQGHEELSLLPERAPSEGPRSTAAVESFLTPLLGWTLKWIREYEWTRAVEDQSAPIPEELMSELGGIICNLA
jgi:hypothetical protein